MKHCAICARNIERDDAAVLVMGPYGNPRLLCDSCEADIVTATTSRDYDEIVAAIERITKRVSESPIIDQQSYETVCSILESAGSRAVAIRDGSYDFSLDDSEPAEEGLDEIPEELRETAEDAELDRRDEEEMEKVNKIMNYVTIGAFAAVGLFLIYRLLDWLVF